MIPESFHFLRPGWLLALVPAALLLFAAARSARDASPWRRLVDEHLLRHLLIVDGDRTRTWPIALLGVAWLAACVALAGPTWEQIPQPTYNSRTPTVIALEMSPAMDVADPAPSRLMHARHKIQDLLDETRGGQVALVLYSGDAFVAAPLTDDGRVIAEMVPSLVPGLMPGAESRPERAIAEANKLLDQAGVPGGQIVLIAATPGDDPAAARAAAEAAKARGRRFSVLGVGTSEGAPLVDARGRIVKGDDGKPVVSRLDTSALRALANAGGGSLTPAAADGSDVHGLIASPLAESNAHDRERTSTQTDTWRDAGVSLIAIPALLAPLAFRRGWLVALTFAVLLGGAPRAEASTWQDLWKTPDQQGQAALATGQATDAAALFENPGWKAAAQYQGGNFAEAAKAYEKLQGSENRYNLGNALAKAGQLEPAIKAYDQALAEQPNHDDAKFNRDLVKRLLDEQKKQQQQSQKQNQSGGGQSDQKNDQSQNGQGGQDSQNAQGDKGSQSQKDAQNQSGDGQQDQKSQKNDGGSQSASSGDSQKSSGSQGQDGEQKQDQAKNQDQKPTDSGSSNDAQAKSGSDAEQKADAQQAKDSAGNGDQEQRQANSAQSSPSSDDSQKQAGSGSAEQKPQTGEKGGGGAQTAADDSSDPQPRPRTAKADDSQKSGESLADKVNRALSGSPEETAKSDATAGGDSNHKPTTEQEQAREQMLRQVPDDPAGLLRARIRRHFAENSISQREGD